MRAPQIPPTCFSLRIVPKRSPIPMKSIAAGMRVTIERSISDESLSPMGTDTAKTISIWIIARGMSGSV